MLITSGGDLAPSLGGGKCFRGPRFLIDVFFEKIAIFRPKNSDDLSFSHRPGCPDSPYLYCVKCRIRSFLHKKNHYFRKKSLTTPSFLLCSYFRAHPTTLLLKILGDGCMGRPPPQ